MKAEPWNPRHEFEGRPAIFVLLGLVVGLTAVSHPVNLLAIFALLWLRSLPGRCWCALFFVVGLATAPTQPAPLNGRQFFTGIGTVSSMVRTQAGTQRCEVRTPRGLLDLELTNGPELGFGDRVSLKGVAAPYEVSDERLEHKLSLGTLRAGPGDVTINQPAGPIAQASTAWRSSFQRVSNSIQPDAAAIVESSVFGIDDASPAMAKRLRATGAISVLSVSGLQVLLLAGMWMGAAAKLPIQRSWALLALAFVLAIYANAAGLHAGVVRAVLMTLMVAAAYLVRRTPDVLSVLALTATAELLWRPIWVFDFGFQMSFVVVATLALGLPSRTKISESRPLPRLAWYMGGLAVLFLAAAPMVAYQTGRLSLLSPVSGAAIAAAVPPMFGLSILGWLVGLVHAGLGALWFQWLVAPFAGWILLCSDAGSRLVATSLEIPPFNAYLLLPIYALIAMGARITSGAFAGERRR